MIIVVLVLSMFGYGIYGAYQQETKDAKAGLRCESDKIDSCRGFDKKNGFYKHEISDDDYFNNLTDGDFVKRNPAIVIDRQPAVIKKGKTK